MPEYTDRKNLPKPLGNENHNRANFRSLIDAIDDNPEQWIDLADRMAVAANPSSGNLRLQVVDEELTLLNSAGASIVVGEKLLLATSGTTPNGSVTAFLIGAGVSASKCFVLVNGLMRQPGTDYSFVAGENHVDFLWTPATGDRIQMIYVGA